MGSVTREHGFSMIEMLAATAVVGIVALIALPMTGRAVGGLRLKGDAQGLSSAVALTKMRAASSFSRARLYADLGMNWYMVQVWDKSADAWITEGSPIRMSGGVSFGMGGIGQPPPSTQVAIGQSDPCLNNEGEDIGGTACIMFNSRGIPVDGEGAPTGRSALYISNGVGVYGVTITATPLVRLWWAPAGRASWVQQ